MIEMAKKLFFTERTVAEIKSLRLQTVKRNRGLVEKIESLDSSQALVIEAQIIPQRFFEGTTNSYEAAKKAYKHGSYISVAHPKEWNQALRNEKSPPRYIRETLKRRLENNPEEMIEAIGYEFRPLQGEDKRKRRVPFIWLAEGARLFAYASKTPEGIPVKSLDDAQRIRDEGTSVAVTIPSREEKKERYHIMIHHVPVFDQRSKYAIPWSLTTSYAEGRVPEHLFWNIRYPYRKDNKENDVLTFYPQDIAAYFGVATHYLLTGENSIPVENSPFLGISKAAAQFSLKLGNNILVRDPRLDTKDKLRPLYLTERSILLARRTGKLGVYNTLFREAKRDGKIADYPWVE